MWRNAYLGPLPCQPKYRFRAFRRPCILTSTCVDMNWEVRVGRSACMDLCVCRRQHLCWNRFWHKNRIKACMETAMACARLLVWVVEWSYVRVRVTWCLEKKYEECKNTITEVKTRCLPENMKLCDFKCSDVGYIFQVTVSNKSNQVAVATSNSFG